MSEYQSMEVISLLWIILGTQVTNKTWRLICIGNGALGLFLMVGLKTLERIVKQ